MYLPKKVGEVARCGIWEELDGYEQDPPLETSTLHPPWETSIQRILYRHARTAWEEVYSAYYIHTMGGSGDKKDWDNLG